MWRRLRNTHVLLHVRANGDYQEKFPAPSAQAAPEPAGPSRPASVPDRLSRLMAINLVYGNGSALRRL